MTKSDDMKTQDDARPTGAGDRDKATIKTKTDIPDQDSPFVVDDAATSTAAESSAVEAVRESKAKDAKDRKDGAPT